MNGEPPEWMLWTMFGRMAFIMLIPLLKALAPLPLPRSRPRAAHTPSAAARVRAPARADLGEDRRQGPDAEIKLRE
jgi:hypothetical protein